jgi:hypothetical protein
VEDSSLMEVKKGALPDYGGEGNHCSDLAFSSWSLDSFEEQAGAWGRGSFDPLWFLSTDRRRWSSPAAWGFGEEAHDVRKDG